MRVRSLILSCALTALGAATSRAQQQPEPTAPPPPSDLTAPSELESSATTGNAVADARHTQLLAAQANAAAALRESVLSLEVGRWLHVRDLVDRTRSADVLSRALATARPLGGARWIDDQTCQVQLAIQGSAVVDAVGTMLARYPGGRAPVRIDQLNGWRRTAFCATGSSAAGGAAVQQVRPRQMSGPWAEVSDDDRRRAVAAAQDDVIHQVSDDLRRAAEPLSTAGHPGVADALQRPAVVTRVRAYLNAQPVTRIEFMDNLTVSLSMTVDGAGLGRTAERAVVEDQPRFKVAADVWNRFRAAVAQAIPPSITGTAAAAPPAAGVPAGLPAVVLPVQPPEWVDSVLTARGSASAPRGSQLGQLRLMGLANADAVAQLRTKLLALRISPTATLGDAVRIDPQLSAAVSRVLLDTQPYNTRFQADGSVAVMVNLNLHSAWDQLRSNP